MRSTARRLTLALLLALAALPLAAGTTAAAGTVVLGSSAFAKPHGEGWGTARPVRIFNGGDPSGLVKEIQWSGWGAKTAIGYGLGYIFKPQGGYYERPVLVELRAQARGHCGSRQAYTQLAIRVPAKPEGALGAWQLWAGAKSLCTSGA